MVNSWSLLYEVLNGTMDEIYPVKDDKNEDSINLEENNINGLFIKPS